VSGEADSFRATLLPVRPLSNPDGTVVSLVGHFARSNDQLAFLRRTPRAAMLVLGPHGYISPSWMNDRTQAPTWNYASAQLLVELEFFEDPQQIEAHLRDLVAAMEAGRPRHWSVQEMGRRYQSLAQRVIGFRARVCAVRAKFKLGQDERDDVFRDIMVVLEQSAEHAELLEWMRLFDARQPVQ
jgi:transcriptional regulator